MFEIIHLLWKLVLQLLKFLQAPQHYYFLCPSWSAHFNSTPMGFLWVVF